MEVVDWGLIGIGDVFDLHFLFSYISILNRRYK